MYFIIKAIHIIFVVSYFAGVFYMIRIFVYYKDAEEKTEIEKNILQKQYVFMMKRLWNIITLPAGIIMLLSGITLIILNSTLLSETWFHIKVTLLVLLGINHYMIWTKITKIQSNQEKSTSLQLRIFNEIASVFLILIVFVVILKSYLFEVYPYLLLGFLAFFIFMFTIVKIVNKRRK